MGAKEAGGGSKMKVICVAITAARAWPLGVSDVCRVHERSMAHFGLWDLETGALG